MWRYRSRPVPAGISFPMITFSFRPRSESDLAWIAASVSTRVVSWKEAADSHDSVASDALVMPIRTARPEGAAAVRGAAFVHHRPVDLLEPGPLDQLAGQQLGVAGFEHVHPLQHLPDDDLDVLVVDRDTLRPVHLLHLMHEVQLDRPAAEDAQHLVRVDRARDELLADGHVAAVADQKPGTHRDLVRRLFRAVVGHHDDLPGLLGLLDLDPALVLTDGRHALRDTGLEELLDTRQAVGDVLARHTTGVEGPHGELGAGLGARLSGDDADGLADVPPLARGERAAVALAADADLGLADHHAVRADGFHAGLGQPVDHQLGRV